MAINSEQIPEEINKEVEKMFDKTTDRMERWFYGGCHYQCVWVSLPLQKCTVQPQEQCQQYTHRIIQMDYNVWSVICSYVRWKMTELADLTDKGILLLITI